MSKKPQRRKDEFDRKIRNMQVTLSNLLRETYLELKETEFYKDTQSLDGLCDMQVTVFKRHVDECVLFQGKEWRVYGTHGEVSHTPRIPSKYWPLQHTWIVFELEGCRYYLDATISQFQGKLKDIGMMYCDSVHNKDFLADKDNLYVKLLRLDYKLFPSKRYNGPIVKFGDWFVYSFQGTIYDIVGKLLRIQWQGTGMGCKKK